MHSKSFLKTVNSCTFSNAFHVRGGGGGGRKGGGGAEGGGGRKGRKGLYENKLLKNLKRRIGHH